MKEVICPKDFYDEDGVLLIAKGITISLDKFRRLDRKYRSEKIPTPNPEREKYIEQVRKLKEHYQQLNVQALDQASNLLITTIFESKQKPWWMHINALGNYTDWLYTHSIDVALISLMMAVELGYPPKILSEISLGAVLHDIGKLLIPKQILQKTTALTAEERAVIQQHCELGWDSVAECSLSEVGKEIILQHHERLDGSGYPNQLKAEQISEYAKIVMIADSFDAITAERPYKKSKGVKEAFSILKNQKEEYSQEYLDVLEDVLVEM